MANRVYDSDKDSAEPTTGSRGDSNPPLGGDPSTPDTGNQERPSEDGTSSAQNENSPSNRSDLNSAEQNNGFYNPKGDGGSEKSAPRELNQSESNPSDASSGFASGFNGPSKKSGSKNLKNIFAQNRTKFLTGGMIGGGGLVTLFVILFSLIPLKIEHMVKNIEDRFFASLNSAIEDTTTILAKQYIRKYVIPDYKNCGTTISRECRVSIVGGKSNPATNMYRAWAKVKIENKLATEWGIELKYNPHSDTWYMKGPGTGPNGDSIGRNGERIDEVMDRSEISSRIIQGMDGETKFKKLTYRYKVGRLLSRTDGTKRYIFFNGTRNSIKGSIDDKKRAAKLILAERVLQPRKELTFIAVKCILTEDCHPERTQPELCEGEPDCAPRPPTSDVENEQRTTLEKLAAEYGVSDMEKLNKIHKDMSERGFQRYLTDQVLQQVFKKEAAQKITDAVPVVGWINLAAEIVNAANDAGPKIKKLSYLTNSIAAVQLYMTYRTYADEIHTGNVDPAVVGAMSDSLGPGVQSKTDPLVGGTASAEESPIYDEVMQGGQGSRSVASTSSSPLLASILAPKASAASTPPNPDISPNYVCNNGERIPEGRTLCSEEELGGGNAIANSVNDFLNLPGLNVIVGIAQVWRSTFGQIFKFVGDVAGGVIDPVQKVAVFALNTGCGVPLVPDALQPANRVLPGYCDIKDAVEVYAPKIAEGVTNWLIPNPFGTNMGGGRTVTMMAAGADVAGKQSCDSFGCQQVEPAVVGNIVNEQQRKKTEAFNSQSLFARTFDTNSTQSLVSRLAIATPFNVQDSAVSGFASILSNPVSIFANSFGGTLSSNKASAATPVDGDPFGIGASAFPKNKIPKDPEKYWDDHNCGDYSANGPIAKWQKAAADGAVNPDTGMPVHRDVEPCLLIKQVTGVDGGLIDKTLLTQDDLAEVGGEINPGGTKVTAATYNVLGASHTDGPATQAGAKNDLSVRRTERLYKVIKDNDFDVVGLQELEESQRQKLVEISDEKFSIYPTNPVYSETYSANSIIWKKSRFELVEGGRTKIFYFNGADAYVPWVQLVDKASGQNFFVMNTHDPVTNENNPDGAKYREKDAVIHRDEAMSKIGKGLPVILLGDFNSSFVVRDGDNNDRDRLTYCILTKETKIQNAYDVANGKKGTCPTKDKRGIDHIYISKGIEVENWGDIDNEDTTYASDHKPVVADLELLSEAQ